MNIFYLDRDPILAAKYHSDKHVVKMILEYAQLLSTAHRVLDGKECLTNHPITNRKRKLYLMDNETFKWEEYLDKEGVTHYKLILSSNLYKATHINHPSAKWVRKSRENYIWLVQLFESLCLEYYHRYGKSHKSYELIMQLEILPASIPFEEFTQPPQAMPEEYRNEDPVKAYRDYYMNEKRDICTWKTEQPGWFE